MPCRGQCMSLATPNLGTPKPLCNHFVARGATGPGHTSLGPDSQYVLCHDGVRLRTGTEMLSMSHVSCRAARGEAPQNKSYVPGVSGKSPDYPAERGCQDGGTGRFDEEGLAVVEIVVGAIEHVTVSTSLARASRAAVANGRLIDFVDREGFEAALAVLDRGYSHSSSRTGCGCGHPRACGRPWWYR